MSLKKSQNKFIYKLAKGKHSNAEIRKMIKQNRNRDGSISNSISDADSAEIDQIGTRPLWTKKKERTFLQKRNDAKNNFLKRLAQWREEDLKNAAKREGRELTNEELRELETPVVIPNRRTEEWEENLWGDVF